MAMGVMRRWIWSAAGALLCTGPIAACTRASPIAASEGEAGAAPRLAADGPAEGGTELKSAATPAPEPIPASVPATVLEPDVALSTGDYIWNADGVPATMTQIVVDLAAQKIYVYRGTVQIGRSTINYGADNKPTPTGTFRILQKKRHHISNLYGAPMPYMLRLTMDGIAIHASPVEDGAATHGCIGVPAGFAALLFGEAGVGTRVVVTNGGDVSLGGVA